MATLLTVATIMILAQLLAFIAKSESIIGYLGWLTVVCVIGWYAIPTAIVHRACRIDASEEV